MMGSTINIAVLELMAFLAFLISPNGMCLTFLSNGRKGVLFELCPVNESEPIVRP